MRKSSKILCILTMFFVLLPLFWIFGEKALHPHVVTYYETKISIETRSK